MTGAPDWYERRGDLRPGMAFTDHEGDAIRLDRRVPGDGTRWYAEIYCNGHWLAEDHEIEPGDLRNRRPELDA